MKGLLQEVRNEEMIPPAGRPHRRSLLIILALLIAVSWFLVSSAGRVDGKAAAPYSVYVTLTITNEKILPDTRVIPGKETNLIQLAACRGEYESATFTVKAHEFIQGLSVTSTDLHGEKGKIPAGDVDIRVVKCWYQAGIKIFDTKKRLLTPELLLKDDSLIKVDYRGKHNYMRRDDSGVGDPYVLISGGESDEISDIRPKDAATLQPVDCEKGTNKQFWVTVRVPEGTVAGNYTGKLVLSANKVPAQELVLNLHVLPFDLEKPALRYSLYYRGRLSKYPLGDPRLRTHKNLRAFINSNWKSSDQYLAELRDMKAHGVEYPTFYQSDEKLFGQEVILRDKVGLPKDALYSLGAQTGNASSPEALVSLQNKVRKWNRLAKKSGYESVYFYGIDEAKGDQLVSQRLAWKAVREAGGNVFAAIHKGNFSMMGEDIDLGIVPGPLDPREAANYHKLGRKIFSYSNPQVGEETPETYRRNYGVLLWKAGYDGTMNYAYQHSANNIWNDFDDPKYRDHVFAYPTVDGVIDTLQFEGFREAVDDVRYLTTLTVAIRRAKKSNPEEAIKAQRWLDAIEGNGDLNSLRMQVIQKIITLQHPNS